MDVKELCGGKPRKVVGQVQENKAPGAGGIEKLWQEKQPAVCWLKNSAPSFQVQIPPCV